MGRILARQTAPDPPFVRDLLRACLAACQACGYTVPCQATAGCQYNDGACLQTNNENSCGNPMLGMAQFLCGGGEGEQRDDCSDEAVHVFSP